MKTRDIAEFLLAELIGDGEVEITGVADITTAAPSELAFFDKTENVPETDASCLIIPETASFDARAALIKTSDPKLAFSRVAQLLHPVKKHDGAIHPSSEIAETAVLGGDVHIGPFVSIGDLSNIGDRTQIGSGSTFGDNVRVGNNCLIGTNVAVYDGATIGNDVTLHSGAVIGADGFGFVRGDDSYIKFPQIGTVVIEDQVEIGANTCIDRGSLGETRIGEGTKIDNLVQIAHNVQIGKRVVIAAQTGISGSVIIEDDCIIGGQVGIGDHARIQSGAIIGSQAGILPGKIVRPGVWWGTPVQPLDDYKRQNAHLKGIGRLKEEIKQLERQIETLRNKSA